MTVSHPSSDPPGDAAASTDEPQLELRGCRKEFAGPAGSAKTVAMDQVSLSIPRGQVVAIVGSNGAGKSTLLSVVSGSAFPEAGHVIIDSDDVTTMPSWARARYIGMVRQSPDRNVLATLTVEENFALALSYSRPGFRLRRALSGKVKESAREALRVFDMGLEEKLGALAQHLSGGQRQAVAVAMATIRRPSVLLLDEHVAALDPKSATTVMRETTRVIDELNITTVMVTHDMGLALAHSDRLLMMHRGRIVMDVSGEEKKQLDVPDLIQRFEAEAGSRLPDRTVLN